jgi:hypothetical protein
MSSFPAATNGPANVAPFKIFDIERVSYGSKRATARVAILGVGVIDVDYFEPAEKPPFVSPRSIRAKFSDKFERCAKFDPPFAAAVLAAVQAQLAANA